MPGDSYLGRWWYIILAASTVVGKNLEDLVCFHLTLI